MSTAKAGRLLLLLACFTPLIAADEDQSKTKTRDDASSVQYSHPSRFRLGGISVGASYSHFSGPFYGPYYCGPYGYRPLFWNSFGPYCSPFFDLYAYSPIGYPGYYPGFARGPNMGEVKLHADDKKAEVFVNGAYAGVAEDLKSMWLEPGAYDLEVRVANRAPFNRRVYVLSGKTLKIDATQEYKP